MRSSLACRSSNFPSAEHELRGNPVGEATARANHDLIDGATHPLRVQRVQQPIAVVVPMPRACQCSIVEWPETATETVPRSAMTRIRRALGRTLTCSQM